MELPRIVMLRLGFFRRMARILRGEDKRQVIYMDETWVFQKGSGKGKSWQDVDLRSCQPTDGNTGKRYIVTHAGGRNGFVPGAGLVYSSASKPDILDDYHGDMNSSMFKKWFTEDLLPNLNQPTVIVMDNAPYHRFQVYCRFISYV